MTEPTPIRIPGDVTPAAQIAAMERLLSAMLMVITINRTALEPYRVALTTALAAAHYGAEGSGVKKILEGMLKRIDAHVATLPGSFPGPGAAA